MSATSLAESWASVGASSESISTPRRQLPAGGAAAAGCWIFSVLQMLQTANHPKTNATQNCKHVPVAISIAIVTVGVHNNIT
jgi:hypothetical protein